MDDSAALRFLELVTGRLDAEDTHLEIGGTPPSDPCCLSHSLSSSRRIVVRWAEPPADPAASLSALEELCRAFAHTLGSLLQPVGSLTATRDVAAYRALADALQEVADAAGADAAVIVDRASDLVWAHCPSFVEGAAGVIARAAILPSEGDAAAGDDRWRDLGEDLRKVEQSQSAWPDKVPHSANSRSLGRRLLRTYFVLIRLEHGRSAMHADATLRRALPRLERLLAKLPSFTPDQGPGGPPPRRLALVPPPG